MTTADYAVTVEGLNKHFGAHHAVKNLSMQIRQGEIFGFLGPNGSGKTTSIRMMCGLLTPDSGSGTCLGYDIIRQRAEVKRRVGYMTQRFSYWEDLSIRENLDFVARLYQVPNRKAVVDETLEELQLTSRAKQLAGSLSGGWKQRLALAASLLHKPKLLLLDEPTAGVDPTARRIFWEELHQLAAKGISILVSTHYMDEAERCHRLAYISYGELLCQGTSAEMIQQRQLTTWQITGRHLVQLNRTLEACPGVEQVVAFGTALHVSGTQAELLRDTVEQHATREGYDAKIIDTSLEDVFINLMKTSEGAFN
ncbi:ABC transporter ATP-binding protein [Paludibacterium purpuratum]|uniref:ABC-2 type transport system ATP-binding protein n=1 Tax=Paludibacterium purpuratum TaxID=1144873 RepID=A0A4R7B9J7_9NEIS|nr:ABC transporter ATP-binding protein [Paludibacterium purpuratum]TDR81554.1 ABC-2 type transport system ATP-binding protein [Paludibacterium purpuratum]